MTAALVTTLSACNSSLPEFLQNSNSENSACCSDTFDAGDQAALDTSLNESADRAAGAAEVLAQIEAARTAPQEPPVAEGEMSKLPPELLRPTTVEWMGPALDLTNELSRNIGYEFAVMGQMPPVDVMVSISAVDEPAVKVFENIGYQVSEFATVFLDPNTKRVEFRFKTNHIQAMEAPAAMPAPARNTQAAPKVVRKDRIGK